MCRAAMPEAPVYEHGNPGAAVAHVGPAWHASVLDTVASAKTVDCLAQLQLGSGVASSNAGHDAAAGGRIDLVHGAPSEDRDQEVFCSVAPWEVQLADARMPGGRPSPLLCPIRDSSAGRRRTRLCLSAAHGCVSSICLLV